MGKPEGNLKTVVLRSLNCDCFERTQIQKHACNPGTSAARLGLIGQALMQTNGQEASTRRRAPSGSGAVLVLVVLLWLPQLLLLLPLPLLVYVAGVAVAAVAAVAARW